MSFGLEENTISDIIKTFAFFPEVSEVILYGSRAKGTYRPGSDIDLAISGANLDLSVLNSISMQLDELYLPNIFDLAILSHIDRAYKQDGHFSI